MRRKQWPEKTSQPSTEQDAYLHPGCRISVSWQGESFKGTVLKVVGKGSRVKVLLDRTDEWGEHEHEVGVKDVKPLEGEGGRASKKSEMRGGHMMRDGGGEQLVRSEKSVSGFKGVVPNRGRYRAKCTTSPCHDNYLGSFDTPEETAQAYLQHQEKDHPAVQVDSIGRSMFSSAVGPQGSLSVTDNNAVAGGGGDGGVWSY